MRKLAASIAVLAILAVGGWFGLQAFADHRLRTELTRLRGTLRPGESVTYTHAQVVLLHRGADFTDVEVRWHGAIMRAHTVRLSDVGQSHLGGAELTGVTFQINGIEGSVAGIDAHDLYGDPAAHPPQLNQIRVGSMRWHSTDLRVPAIPGFSTQIAEFHFSQSPDQAGTLIRHSNADQVQVSTQAGPTLAIGHIDDETHGVVQGGRLVDLTVHGTMTGLQIPSESTLGRQLASIGYDSAQGDGSSHIHYIVAPAGAADGVAEATAVMDPTVLRLAGIGQITVAMKLDHLPVPDAQAANTATGDDAGANAMGAAKIAQARLISTTITWNDAGLTARIVKRLAERSGTSPDQLRDRLRHVIQARGEADGNSGFEPEIIHFLDDPRQLVIALNPSTPVTISDLGGIQHQGAAAATLLGLTVKAD